MSGGEKDLRWADRSSGTWIRPTSIGEVLFVSNAYTANQDNDEEDCPPAIDKFMVKHPTLRYRCIHFDEVLCKWAAKGEPPATGGALAISVLFEQYDCEMVRLYGFANSNLDAPYHYWRDGSSHDQVSTRDWYKSRLKRKTHDFQKEHQIMHDLLGRCSWNITGNSYRKACGVPEWGKVWKGPALSQQTPERTCDATAEHPIEAVRRELSSANAAAAPAERVCAGDASVLPGSDVCLLAATATSRPHAPRVRTALAELCNAHGKWVRTALNYFDGSEASTDSVTYVSCLHSTTFVPGFKTRYWRDILIPTFMRPFSHVLLFDSDMEVSPQHFDLIGLLRFGTAANVSIISPAPIGAGAGMFNLGAHPDSSLRRACVGGRAEPPYPKPEEQCAVCRQGTVEVKAPLFTAAAWGVVHKRIFADAPDYVLVAAEGIDNVWCGLVAHELHSCTWPRVKNPKNTMLPNCVGISCAYSYATPMRHLDDKVIQSAICQNGTRAFNPYAMGTYMRRAGHSVFNVFPSWRPRGSLLDPWKPGPPGRPCWTVEQLKANLPALSDFDGKRAAALAEEARRNLSAIGDHKVPKRKCKLGALRAAKWEEWRVPLVVGDEN